MIDRGELDRNAVRAAAEFLKAIGRPVKRHLNRAQRQQVAEMYVEGHVMRTIAARYRVGQETIRRIIKRKKIKLRPRGWLPIEQYSLRRRRD